MITAQEAYTIAQGDYPKELKYIEDTIRTAAEMKMTCCIIEEEVSDAAQEILESLNYKVRFIRLHNGYITYINWAKE